MKKKNQKIGLGLSCLSECSKASPQKLVVLHCISLRASACRSTISGSIRSVTFPCFLCFFPFVELAVLAVNFVELSPSHKSEILGLGNFEKRFQFE